MSDPNLTARIRLDDSEAEEQESQWKLRLRSINNQIRLTRLEIRKTQYSAIAVVQGVMGLLSVIVNYLPEPLQIVGRSVMTAVNAVVTAVTTTAMAYTAAAPANPILLIQASFAWAGVAIALLGVAAAATGQQEINAELSKMRGSVSQTWNSINSIIRGLGGYPY